jgi:predicted O-methyltransferase YrrM
MPFHVASKPWIALGAIDFIEHNLDRMACAFEWGSGGSTIWFSQMYFHVISVESDAGWYEDVGKALDEADLRPTRHLSPVADYTDDVPANEAYAAVIEQYPDWKFGLILIDGPERSRLACAEHAIGHMLPGGLMVLDNAGSTPHLAAAALLDKTLGHRNSFIGPVYSEVPETQCIVETAIWHMV